MINTAVQPGVFFGFQNGKERAGRVPVFFEAGMILFLKNNVKRAALKLSNAAVEQPAFVPVEQADFFRCHAFERGGGKAADQLSALDRFAKFLSFGLDGGEERIQRRFPVIEEVGRDLRPAADGKPERLNARKSAARFADFFCDFFRMVDPAILYSHSHIDHYGGIMGAVKAEQVADAELSLEEQLASGKILILAPEGFLKHAVSENIYCGPAMGRRAQYQYGSPMKAGEKDRMAIGIGLG